MVPGRSDSDLALRMQYLYPTLLWLSSSFPICLLAPIVLRPLRALLARHAARARLRVHRAGGHPAYQAYLGGRSTSRWTTHALCSIPDHAGLAPAVCRDRVLLRCDGR